ncbi:MAG: hypothetical protein ACK5CA_11225 [Cyanobacteriota bacterium]|jgi:hypothetical protein
MSLIIFLIFALVANAFFVQGIVNLPILFIHAVQSLAGFLLLALFLALMGWGLGD